MCGRFNNHLPRMHAWSDMFSDWPSVPLSYNIAPSSQIAAFFVAEESASINPLQSASNIPLQGASINPLQGASMRWGMVPAWAKEFDSKYATFNARIESVEDKPTYRNAWKAARRCVIPMAGYYEWRRDEQGQKQAVYISDRDTGGLLAAGLYEPWQDRLSCTMLTREANQQLACIHHRMPILLSPAAAQAWLTNKTDDVVEVKNTLMTIESPNVVYWPVGSAVGNPRNDDPSLIKPIDTD